MRRALLLVATLIAVGCSHSNGRPATHPRFRSGPERLEWLGRRLAPLADGPVEWLLQVPELSCRLKKSNGRKSIYRCRVFWPDGRGIGKLKAKVVDGRLADWTCDP